MINDNALMPSEIISIIKLSYAEMTKKKCVNNERSQFLYIYQIKLMHPDINDDILRLSMCGICWHLILACYVCTWFNLLFCNLWWSRMPVKERINLPFQGHSMQKSLDADRYTCKKPNQGISFAFDSIECNHVQTILFIWKSLNF